MQADLFVENDREEDSLDLKASLGNNLVLQFSDPEKSQCSLIHQGKAIKIVDLKDKVAKKVLVIEAVALNVNQTRLASALGISRQTIHNYRESHKYFGMEGLVHGYNPEVSKNLAEQRRIHAQEREQGNKAKQVAQFRAREREAEQAERERVQGRLNFSYGEKGRIQEVPAEQQPFAQNHEWEATRYAGLFVYWISLIGEWNWLDLVMGHFGKAWRIFAVFLLMAGGNKRSLEQLKHVRKREAGRLLGLGKLPAHTMLAQWFHEAARMGVARTLLDDYFRHQLRCGLVAGWLWFCDGHLLPYTGKAKVHYSYNTQRRIPVPGRTSQVTCDQSGRIVDFVIEEGKGEMKARILETVEKWRSELPARPIQVFDREGYDSKYFSKLVKAGQPFVTWDKNVDHKQLNAIADERFTTEFVFNGKRYHVLEGEKTFPHAELEEGLESHFTLRHLILWNHSSQRRTAGLAYDGGGELSTEDAAQAILSRWGASENTFKHIQNRHPFHYHPGFSLVESERQEITNPLIKEKTTLLSKLKKGLDKLYRQLAQSPEGKNKDGAPRKNSVRERIKTQLAQQQALIEQTRKERDVLPEKIDVSRLSDYRSFERIDNEGKYLFDFVTTSVWNARKQMVDWLKTCYQSENDVVDLFYAITDSHGWIRSTAGEVRVRLEPLQQARRRAAQETLCRKLTSLGAQTPTGKLLVIEVGESPLD